jgi:uncharacterized protein (DUF885 family)
MRMRPFDRPELPQRYLLNPRSSISNSRSSNMQRTFQETHIEFAESYFDYLAEHFPVMCASDEFHFLPRAENASNHYDKLDNLDADAIAETIDRLISFQKELPTLRGEDDDLEKQLDIDLLHANISGFLIEFMQKRSWQYNPILYLKIAFIGLDHALHKPSASFQETIERSIARLSKIPRILKQAAENIDTVPDTYYQASLYMIDDCRQYLEDIIKPLAKSQSEAIYAELFKMKNVAVASLDSLQRFLNDLRPASDHFFAGETLERTLNEHFLCIQSLDNIFRIAEESWKENLSRLEELKLHIDPAKSWQQIYHEYNPSEINGTDTMALYAQEIENLRSFFKQQGFDELTLNSAVEVSETPMYLRSVRGAASFAAAYTSNPEERSYFYISTRLAHQPDDQVQRSLKKRFHREYRLLTAHETIPGHHYLDSVRRRLKNPIRRQIESPLFYEGWASYAESLLVEYGYMKSPLDLMIDLKRNLWRSARCLIDVGLTTGKISTADASELLKICSFSPGEARRQIDRFQLNPGYQVCYSLGNYEFTRLKKVYAGRLGNKRFHKHLLEGGELPFQLIDKRFARICL